MSEPAFSIAVETDWLSKSQENQLRSAVRAAASACRGPSAGGTRHARGAVRGCRIQASEKRLESEGIAEAAIAQRKLRRSVAGEPGQRLVEWKDVRT